jgi:hypothetical protein
MANPARSVYRGLVRDGKYEDGQLRTLQRKVKYWRATEGPAREVFFSQEHYPGDECQSDFTHMDSLGITIQRQPFDHMVYHFVLPYSNWETGTICFSESMESLREGFQNALFQLTCPPKVGPCCKLVLKKKERKTKHGTETLYPRANHKNTS